MQDKNKINSLKRSRDDNEESLEVSIRSTKRTRENSIFEKFINRLANNDLTLTQLNLGFYQINDSVVQEISVALEQNTILTELNLVDNHISDFGAQAIGVALEKNRMLAKLNLRNNHISDSGVEKISVALAKNTTLTQLNLEYNDISDIGAQTLKVALATNITLTQLDLENSQIDDIFQIDEVVLEEINSLINRNKEIAVKKEQSFESIKTSAKVLSILSRHRNGIFFSLPREMNIKIASLTGDSDAHSEAQLMEITKRFFK